MKDIPNIIVDGSPNDSTVLTLSHWKENSTPALLKADVSAEIAFRYLENPRFYKNVEAVSNNHFDEDGLVSMYILINPEFSMKKKDLFIQIAEAGDFGIYKDRKAARIAYTISSLSDENKSPFDKSIFQKDYYEGIVDIHNNTLEIFSDLVLNTEKYEKYYKDEEEFLDFSEKLINTQKIIIEEKLDLDLAIIEIPAEYRKNKKVTEILSPMAIHNNTRMFKILLICGNDFELYYRYESWVDYISELHPPRIDLHELRWELNLKENGYNEWKFTGNNSLVSRLKLKSPGGSSLEKNYFISMVVDYLKSGGRIETTSQ